MMVSSLRAIQSWENFKTLKKKKTVSVMDRLIHFEGNWSIQADKEDRLYLRFVFNFACYTLAQRVFKIRNEIIIIRFILFVSFIWV